MKAYWTCPHCRHQNVENVPDGTDNHRSYEIGYCDSDSGGCDEMVPIRLERVVTATATPINVKQFKEKAA
ncbi:MAG TPA: hypothetical protein DCZ63_06095 [Geobacter sp.]|nr:hypothetical protein [Geobacter sp.]